MACNPCCQPSICNPCCQPSICNPCCVPSICNPFCNPCLRTGCYDCLTVSRDLNVCCKTCTGTLTLTDKGEISSTDGAALINKKLGKIILEAGANQVTVSNNTVLATSNIFISIVTYPPTGASTPLVYISSVTNGSFVINYIRLDGNPLTDTLTVSFLVL